MAKSYKLFRCDLAKNILNVNVQHFNNLATEEAEFTKVFGIADTSSSRSSEVKFPYTLTDIATKLQVGNTWHKAKKLLDTIKTNKNVDLQGSDNQYHTRISTGKGHCRKYSEECLFLLKKVMNNEDYTIDI
jgi:hypothetical protein